MITGDDKHWGSPAGFDPALGNWREYTRLIGQAFPGMQFGFDQAPCNFYKVDPDPAIRPSVPWPGLGYGYKLDPLKTMYTHKTVLVDGQPVQLNVDFADLIRTWITLAKVDDASGGSDQRNFAAQALRYIRMTGRERSGPRGYQIAEIGVYGPDAPGADQYIAESWTFTNLARDLVRRVKGIDNTGAPYAANLSVQMPGTTVWQGDGAYDTSGSGSKSIETHSDGAPIDFVVRVRNDGREINPGDCRATMLVRAEEEGGNGWTVRYMADGKDVASDILAKGDADGWFAGGLNPGQSKTFQVEIVPSASPATGDRHSVRFALYWNPQDPLLRARDAITLTVAKR